jgi:hypothetical protein
MPRPILPVLAVMSIMTGCAPAPTDVSAPGTPPVFAKGGAGTNSKAVWSWYSTMTDGSPALLAGDGLAVDGATPAEPSGYEDGLCGVRATIDWYGTAKPSGDAFFGPTSLAADVGCANRRYQSAMIGGTSATLVNWPGYVNGIMQLGLNQQVTKDVLWGPTNNLPCARIKFVSSTGSGVTVKRTAGNTSGLTGEWVIESTGSHLAQCWIFVRPNTLTWDGHTAYFLPFRARIVEILQ